MTKLEKLIIDMIKYCNEDYYIGQCSDCSYRALSEISNYDDTLEYLDEEYKEIVKDLNKEI